jgi:hypothetical protein
MRFIHLKSLQNPKLTFHSICVLKAMFNPQLKSTKKKIQKIADKGRTKEKLFISVQSRVWLYLTLEN